MADGKTMASLPDDGSAAAPKEGTLPKRFGERNNLAGDTELCEKFWSWAGTMYEHFRTQPARDKFTRTGGTMDMCDRMYRVARRRDESSDQHENTVSNVASTMFYRQTRTVTASQMSQYFNDDKLPAEYEPEINTDEYTMEQGKDIADQQNALEQHTFDEDKRRQKIHESLTFNNKYGQEMLSVEWDFLEEERIERIISPDGTVGFEKKKRIIKDNPTLFRHDLKDCFFDAQIDDMDKQRCFLIRKQFTLEDLYGMQGMGFYKNADKISASHLYNGETTGVDVQGDRSTNAGENGTPEATGLFVGYHVWGRVPIKESEGRPGRGRWDNEKTAPSLYWGTYLGQPGDKTAICLRLESNPYFHGKTGFRLIHSLPDDKGAYHQCFGTMLESNYQQATTNINQAIDNITLRTRKPLIADGPVRTRDLTFKANKLITIARGTTLKEIDVQDTTNVTMAFHDRIERDADQTTGADKPIQGQALGSRASATEAKQTLDQSQLPLDAQGAYIADQLFPWMLEMDAALWRQYGDPERVVAVTRSGMIQQIMPARLWGPLKTKVTAVSRFRNNSIMRQELNGYTQNVLPQAAQVMGLQGQRVFHRQLARRFGFDEINEMFPENGDYDAKHIARNENVAILFRGEQDFPQTGENHAAHNAEHRRALSEYNLLPEGERDPERSRMLQEHIMIHDNMAAQEAASAQPPGSNVPQGLPGEIAGNQIEAQEGALA